MAEWADFISKKGYGMISDEQLSILACPACLGELVRTDNGNSLLCIPCSLSYQVKDGIPVMLPDQAVTIQDQGSGDKNC